MPSSDAAPSAASVDFTLIIETSSLLSYSRVRARRFDALTSEAAAA